MPPSASPSGIGGTCAAGPANQRHAPVGVPREVSEPCSEASGTGQLEDGRADVAAWDVGAIVKGDDYLVFLAKSRRGRRAGPE